jgi:hypothetical protein
MNSIAWLEYFRANRSSRAEPSWALPFPEDAATARVLARSLSHFQLGESGGGAFLLREAQRRYADDLAYLEALGLFVAEEQEHSRLLARLVERFGGALIRKHWTHSLFRLIRRVLGVRFELQVLVTAELVGTAYYRVLKHRVRDVVTEQVCDLVLRDEARHVEFHLWRFRADQERWLPLERAAWSLQFQLLFLAAAHVAWVDHGDALRAVGAGAGEYYAHARREAVAFLGALQEPNDARSTAAVSPSPLLS